MRTKALLLPKYLHCLNSLSSKYYFVVSKDLYAFLFFWNPLTLSVTWQAINFSLQYHPWIKNWRLRELRKGSPTKEALNCETNSSCQPSRTCIENRIVNMHMLVKRSVIVKAREVWVGSGVGVLYPTRPKPFRFFTLPLPSRFVLLTERLEQGRLFSQLYKPLQVSNEDMTRLFILSGVFLIVISTFSVQDTYHRDWNQISKRTGRKNKALFLFANATCARSISPISLDLKSTTAR